MATHPFGQVDRSPPTERKNFSCSVILSACMSEWDTHTHSAHIPIRAQHSVAHNLSIRYVFMHN